MVVYKLVCRGWTYQRSQLRWVIFSMQAVAQPPTWSLWSYNFRPNIISISCHINDKYLHIYDTVVTILPAHFLHSQVWLSVACLILYTCYMYLSSMNCGATTPACEKPETWTNKIKKPPRNTMILSLKLTHFDIFTTIPMHTWAMGSAFQNKQPFFHLHPYSDVLQQF